MSTVNLTCHTDRTELTFQGALDVSDARAAYDALNEALVRALPLELHGADMTRLDVAGLQLLAVFCRGAKERGLMYQWRSTGSPLLAAATSAGLTQTLELPT